MAQWCFPQLLVLVFLLSPFITGVAYGSSLLRLVNNCPQTIWPGITPSGGSPNLSTTGFVLQPGDSKSIPAPASWVGRVWGRTHCTQDSTGKFSCLTGDCGSGKVECDGHCGSPPATLVEFRPDDPSGADIYDVSLVDGFNLPILVVPLGATPSEGKCTIAGCAADLIGGCPSELKVTGDGGETVGCNGACSAFAKDEYCCTGDFSSPSACRPTNYSQYFKEACPTAYSYALDDDATSAFTCSGYLYSIVFCSR